MARKPGGAELRLRTGRVVLRREHAEKPAFIRYAPIEADGTVHPSRLRGMYLSCYDLRSGFGYPVRFEAGQRSLEFRIVAGSYVFWLDGSNAPEIEGVEVRAGNPVEVPLADASSAVPDRAGG